MDAQALTGYIQQGIRKEVYADRIELYLPFFFGKGESEPLCLIWDRNGILSDGGRTFAELKKRVGDLTPYQDRIQNILKSLGMVTLEGGHKLVLRHFQTCISGEKTYKDYMGGLNRMLRAISLISIVDTVAVDKDGTVDLC